MEESARLETARGARTVPLCGVSRTQMAERFAHLVRGTADPRFVAGLEVGRAHLVAVNGASEASPVRDVPPEFVETLPRADGGELRFVRGIEELFQACAQQQRLPHEMGTAAWTSPAGRRDLRGPAHFSGPAQEGQ